MSNNFLAKIKVFNYQGEVWMYSVGYDESAKGSYEKACYLYGVAYKFQYCFVFELNYVQTVEQFRRKGFATNLVQNFVNYLKANNNFTILAIIARDVSGFDYLGKAGFVTIGENPGSEVTTKGCVIAGNIVAQEDLKAVAAIISRIRTPTESIKSLDWLEEQAEKSE